MLRVLITVFLVSASLAQQQDLTRVPGAHGSEVVDAVVSRIRNSCLFPDFKLFLRRLAFVASHDGDNPTTFRPGYDGGIWQIDKDKFEQTKRSSQLSTLITKVNQEFAVNWNTVVWSQLRRPLYSGLAAALYLASLPDTVPRVTEDQAPFYQKYFKSSPDASHEYFVGAQTFNQLCPRTNLDLAFVVDGSSSLSSSDFQNAKEFAAKVVDNFKVGPSDVRVAFVTYSKGYKSEFTFNQFTDKAAVKKAIDGISTPGGRTDTDLALTFSADQLFTSSMGSRDGTSKVILLLTDGVSTHPSATAAAAAKARSKGIILFSIGIGQVDATELNAIASAPKCTHMIKLAGYSDLSGLVSEIQKVSCETPAVLNPGIHTYSCSKGGLFQINTNGKETQVTINVSDGQVDIYGSLTNPTPTATVNSFHSSASVGISSVVLIDQEKNPVFLSIKPAGPPNGCTGTFTIKVGNVEMVKPNTLVTCVENERTGQCSIVKLYGRLFTLISPPYNFVNPCVPGHPGFQMHPIDQTKFIFCSTNGTVYVFQCAAAHIYDPQQIMCVPGFPMTSTTTTSTTTTTTKPPTRPQTTAAPQGTNPCTQQHIDNGQFFFPYPPDPSKYIDCSNWPTLGYVKNCPKGKYWDQRDLTCTFKDVVVDPTKKTFDLLPNPCKNPLRDGDLFYYPHPKDRHKYIHCDAFGDAFEKTCPYSRVWNQRLLLCIPDSLQNNVIG